MDEAKKKLPIGQGFQRRGAMPAAGNALGHKLRRLHHSLTAFPQCIIHCQCYTMHYTVYVCILPFPPLLSKTAASSSSRQQQRRLGMEKDEQAASQSMWRLSVSCDGDWERRRRRRRLNRLLAKRVTSRQQWWKLGTEIGNGEENWTGS